MSSEEIKTRLEQLKKDLATAQQAVTDGAAGDDRIVRSLQDSVAMAELRLDNYDRAKKNAQFVSIELDRMESKIQALAEMAVNRQDPDLISSQVDSAAESMRQTEKAVSELQHLTGLADELQDPPPILDADLRQVLRHDS
jgi:delta 1-pyrroline-5-carboxylate dehydrogenase